jgi:hypothetical protein
MDYQQKSNIINVINGLIMALCMKYINTGDKMIDGSITTLISILILSTNMIAYKKLYNKYIFSRYYTNDTPFYKIDFTKFYMFGYGELIYNLSENYPKSTAIMNYILKQNAYMNVIIATAKNDKLNVYPLFIASDGTTCFIYAHYASWSSGDSKSKPYSIHLITENQISYGEVVTYINTICNKYEKHLIHDDTKSNSLFIMDAEHMLGNVSIHKTFDSLYFEQKEELLNILTRFKNKTMYPKKISMDNKLGILLYGPPGTGKTGTISAIANFLGRNIVTINLSSIKRTILNEKLKESFYKDKVIVFDEFDCMLDVLLNKSQINSQEIKQEKESTLAELLAVTEDKEERKNIIEMFKNGRNKNSESVDLPYLLQKLDGLESAEGRIIIATTNNPDLINPVLLRPGRFDLKLCLGNCTSQMYVDILSAFYELDEDGRKTIMKAHLPEKKWSPLQVINTCLTTNNLNSTLKALNK